MGGTGGVIEAKDSTASIQGAGGTVITTTSGLQSVAFGPGNTITGRGSASIGGRDNAVSGEHSGSLAGVGNTVTAGVAAAIAGSANIVSGPGGAVAVGGFANVSDGSSSGVYSAFFSHASGTVSVVVGGLENTASGLASGALGGGGNTSSGKASACVGGENNIAMGVDSSCLGGGGNPAAVGNRAIGIGAVTLGGKVSSAIGNYSAVSGERGVALRESQLTHASSGADVSVPGAVQQSWLELHGVTPGSAAGESVTLQWGEVPNTTFNLENGKLYTLEVDVAAGGVVGGVRNQKVWKYQVTADCDPTSGAVTFLNTTNIVPAQNTIDAASWTFTVTSPSNNQLAFTFTTGSSQVQCAVAAGLHFVEVAYPVL